jgi:polar amino acid transport system substrate-binding protein
MLQVTQYQKTGELRVEDLPQPTLRPGSVLVRNRASVISAGTERTSVETAQASMVGKARSRPDLVRQVVDNAKREGLVATYRKVQNRLDNVKELGYSSAGLVLESGVPGLAPGDAVACAGTAFHAEVVSVPKHLVTRIPDGVDFEEAAFVALGAIALQGVRQADVRIGENVAVVGLGLVGLLTVQLLKAQGCRVIGLDLDEASFELARSLGCDDCARSDSDAAGRIESFTRGYGTDAVLLTASTRSNQPLELALEVARKRSKVVVVGDVSMVLPRSPLYEKELQVTISCSYGPGRYDAAYENSGIDYPVGYVRWTENRNMEAVLDLMASRRLDVRSVITHRFPIERALEAYDLVTGKRAERHVGIVLEYPARQDERTTLRPAARGSDPLPAAEKVAAGFVGAGNFAQSNLLPHLVKLGVPLRGVATSRPVAAQSVAKKFGFAFATTDAAEVLGDEHANAIFVATRHDSHARYVAAALDAGHHVFVEKPLAITDAELAELEPVALAASERGQYLAVGFNRRFAGPIRRIAEFFGDRREPLSVTYRVNAGRLPRDSWIQADDQGGRIVGEGCHFVDVFSALIRAPAERVVAAATRSGNRELVDEDTASVVIDYADGSVATLVYVANGSPRLEKEYLEASCEGRTAVMQDFRKVILYSERRRSAHTFDGRKGHAEEVAHFVDVIRGDASRAFHVDGLLETTRVTFAARASLRDRVPVDVRR